jgi:hypothetical protein
MLGYLYGNVEPVTKGRDEFSDTTLTMSAERKSAAMVCLRSSIVARWSTRLMTQAAPL